MDTKLIERIQKLLSLSESSNEHESKVAMLKAQEILVKHKLSIQEVKNIKISNSKILENKSNISFTKAKWKGKLANLIADNFGCYNYYRTRRVHTIAFFGKEEDVMVCNIVLEYSIDCIESNIKRIQRESKKEGYSVKGIGNDYALGFIDGLKENFEEQKRHNQEWGLILVKDKEVVDAYTNIAFTGSVNSNAKFQGNTDIYHQGVKDGEKFSITDKITEGVDEQVLELKA